MQQMAALTASLGGLTNLNPLLAQQQQTNAELSSLMEHGTAFSTENKRSLQRTEFTSFEN